MTIDVYNMEFQMSNYGKIACCAAKRAQNGVDPREAWRRAAETTFPDQNQKSSRQKSCPRLAFLGLAEEGLLVGIDPGNYTNSERKMNKKYAREGLILLRENPDLCNDKREMWHRVMRKLKLNTRKTPNNQMDVVVALWKNCYIKNSA